MDLERIVLDCMLTMLERLGRQVVRRLAKVQGPREIWRYTRDIWWRLEPSSVRQVEYTYLPWTLQLNDLDTILVNDDLGVALS